MTELNKIQQPEIASESPAELFLAFLITDAQINSNQLAAMGIGIAELSVLLTLHKLDKSDNTKSAQAWIDGRMTSYTGKVIESLKKYLGITDTNSSTVQHAREKIAIAVLAGFGKRPGSFQAGPHAKEVAGYTGPGPDHFGSPANKPESERRPLRPKADSEDNE